MKNLIKKIEEKKEEMIRELENGIDLEYATEHGINEDYIKGLENGLDLANKTIEENSETYSDIMNRLYKEVKNRYVDLDDLCRRLQDNYNNDTKFIQKEEDRIALCAILDILSGHII